MSSPPTVYIYMYMYTHTHTHTHRLMHLIVLSTNACGLEVLDQEAASKESGALKEDEPLGVETSKSAHTADHGTRGTWRSVECTEECRKKTCRKKRKATSRDSEVPSTTLLASEISSRDDQFQNAILLESEISSRDDQFQHAILMVNKGLETMSASPNAALRFQVLFFVFL